MSTRLKAHGNVESKDLAELFLSNYYGETSAAKWAEGFINKGAHKGEFIPWTVMATAMKLLDWNSKVEVIENDTGGYVFRDTVDMQTHFKDSSVLDENTGEVGAKETTTSQLKYAFYVKVKLTYFGEESTHEYAVLDTAHRPVNYIDSQMVNKAIQRNKARAISLITGIGLTLWTREAVVEELEDTDVGEAKKPAVVSKPKLTKPKVDPKTTEESVITQLAKALIENTTDPDFLIKHKSSLEFIKETYGVDYSDKNIETLSEALSKVSGIDGFAKIILQED